MTDAPEWFQVVTEIFAAVGFYVSIILCLFAVWWWRDDAPRRRDRKSLRAAEKAEQTQKAGR